MEESNIHLQCVRQYNAALAMLKQAIDACPEDLWLSDDYPNRFWQIAYHALFYTHLYLHASEAEFRPWTKHQTDAQYLGPRPLAPHEPKAEVRPYSRTELLEYLGLCSEEITDRVPQDSLDAPSGFSWLPFNRLEVHLYNLRHLQHHCGQLTDRLRTVAGIGVSWVRMA